MAGGMNPKAYDAIVGQLEDDMKQAHNLGLYRTAEKLHAALNEARSERFEAQPSGIPIIDWVVGPVREKS